MLVSCPNCATAFSVPESRLGPNGRTLRCAKCRHTWFQPPMVAAGDFGLDDLPPPPVPPSPIPTSPVSREEIDAELEAEMESAVSGAAPPPADADLTAARAAAGPSLGFDLDDDDEPAQPAESPKVPLGFDVEREPIPEVFRQKTEPRKKGGTGGLWLLLVLMLLGGSAGGAFYFQDKVVEIWPPADGIFSDLGLRREKPGSGLELRNAGAPERTVVNGVDVLIVRGIIANVSNRPRPVPPMKLTLLDKNKGVVQAKIDQPPVTSLDVGATAGFSIQIQRPDPNAVEVNVVFIAPSEAKAK